MTEKLSSNWSRPKARTLLAGLLLIGGTASATGGPSPQGANFARGALPSDWFSEDDCLDGAIDEDIDPLLNFHNK